MDQRATDEGGTDAGGTGPPHHFYVINYSITLQEDGDRADGSEREGEGRPTTGTTFMFSPMMPFAMMTRQKPRASERAVAALKRVRLDEIPETERACPICYDPYDNNPDIDIALDDDDDDDDDIKARKEQREKEESEKNEKSQKAANTGSESTGGFEQDDDVAEDEQPRQENSSDGSARRAVEEERGRPVTMESESESDAAAEQPSAESSEANEPPKREEPPHIPVELPCHHRFGLSCIKEWLSSATTCPLCRQEIESEAEYLRATGQQPPNDSQHASFTNVIMGLFPDILRQSTAIVRTFEQQQQNQQGQEGQETGEGAENPGEGEGNSAIQIGHFHLHYTFEEDGDRNGAATSDSSVSSSEGHAGSDSDAASGPSSVPEPPAVSASSSTVNSDEPMPDAPREAASGPPPGPPPGIASSFMPEALRSILRARRFGGGGGGGSVLRRFQFGRPSSPTGSTRGTEGLRSANREYRHHPYRASPSSGTNTPTQDERSEPSEEQCASLPLQICTRQGDDGDDGRLVRLECGHAYHAGCLRMSMRAHGDRLQEDGFESGTDAWCIRCRQYQHVTSTAPPSDA